jgi:molybdopterin-guanine dinucleotide biosynthesis protein A
MAVTFPDVTGALLAGGRGLRFGGLAKGLLKLDGKPLVARSLELFGEQFGASLLVADDAAPYRRFVVRAVGDQVPRRGAPGGLHAALSAATTPWVFAAGCDMPFLSREGIALLAARRQGARAVIPRWNGMLEPLHALWSRDCLPALTAALEAGDASLQGLAGLVGARVVEESAWRMIDPNGRAFVNANTPEEAARLGLVR